MATYTPLPSNAFGNPGQFSAIQNGAKQGSLVSQLFGGTNSSTPATAKPLAAASSVKNPNAPTTAALLTSALPKTLAPAPAPAPVASGLSINSSGNLLTPPTNQPVTSHTVTDSQGNTITQKYATPTTQAPTGQDTVDNSGGTANPNYNFMNPASPAPGGTPVTPPTSALGSAQPSSPTQASALAAVNDLIQKQNSEQSGLTEQEKELETNFANMDAGILTQPGEIGYQTGRQAQLQQTENTGLAALEGTQAELAAYENPQLTALQAEAGQLSPQNQEITPPAGGVTTLANTGQQFSNPIYEPASGAYSALSPQPGGTSGQPSTAGQASQYTVKSGDTLDNIAAANGTTEAALLAANPQIKDKNMIQAGANITIPAAPGNTAFSGGIAAGQATAGQNQVQMQTALGQARSIQTQIGSLLQSDPTLNSSPAAVGNAIKQWASSTQVPTGPYVNLLNDLQEYANTIAPVLGVGGAPTDNKIAIATQLIPSLASGQTIQQAIANLDAIAVGKINAVPGAAANANSPAQVQTPQSTGVSVGWGSLGD